MRAATAGRVERRQARAVDRAINGMHLARTAVGLQLWLDDQRTIFHERCRGARRQQSKAGGYSEPAGNQISLPASRILRRARLSVGPTLFSGMPTAELIS